MAPQPGFSANRHTVQGSGRHLPQGTAPALAPDLLPEHAGYIRPAGPDSMRDPPAEWSCVDEASDQSFPASDPPA